MAKKKKARVPAPPKRVQAPRVRSTTAPRDPRRTRTILLGVGAALVAAAALVGVVLAAGGGGGPDVGASGTCTRDTFPPQGRQHVQELSRGFEYNSTPATSGPHFGTPAVWNLYDRPVEQFRLVHNLEHGGVVVQYGSAVPEATVQRLTDWYAQDPRGLIVAPLPGALEEQSPELESRIVATAWTHLLSCPGFDEGALDDFVDDYRGPGGDAPEEFPLDALQPGAP